MGEVWHRMAFHPSRNGGKSAFLPTLLFPPSKLLQLAGTWAHLLKTSTQVLKLTVYSSFYTYFSDILLEKSFSNWTSHRTQYSTWPQTALLIFHLIPNLLLFKYDNVTRSVLLRPLSNQHSEGDSQSVISGSEGWCIHGDIYPGHACWKFFVSLQHILNKIWPFHQGMTNVAWSDPCISFWFSVLSLISFAHIEVHLLNQLHWTFYS